MARRTITASLACLLVACTSIATRNLCEEDGIERVGNNGPVDCHRCTTDDECRFKGNPCEGVVHCAHRDAPLVSTDLGCNPEPSLPDDDACICRDGYCQVR